MRTDKGTNKKKTIWLMFLNFETAVASGSITSEDNQALIIGTAEQDIYSTYINWFLDFFTVILIALFLFFTPGFLFSIIMIKRLEVLERIILSVGLSIFIVVSLGFLLTGIGMVTGIKGITEASIVLSVSLLHLIFIIILLLKQ